MNQSSIVNEPTFPVVLLTHLVHNTRFLSRAVGKLLVADFNRPGERVYQLLLAVIQDYHKMSGDCIPAQGMALELNARITGAPEAYSQNELSHLQQVVNYIYSEPAVSNLLAFDYMMGQLQLFLNDRRVLVKVVDASHANALDLDARLDELTKVHSATRISSGLILDDFFKSDNIQIAPVIRDDIGVDFVDQLLGGGKSAGEVYGVIGPFGMGKTTLSIQLCVEGAYRKRHSLYVLYEQPFIGDISNRFYGYIGGIPRSRLAGKSFETLHPDDQQRLKERLDIVSPYLHIADMVTDGRSGGGGPEAISALLSTFEDKGTPIEIVYLDQYLPFIRAWMAATNKKEEQLRGIMEGTVYTFMKMATKNRHNCAFFLLHQTSTEGASRSPTAIPKPTDSAECHSLPFWLNSFLQLGVQDKHRRQYAVSGKGRATIRREYIVECDGENWRYTYTPDRFTPGANVFIDTMVDVNPRTLERKEDVDKPQNQEQKAYG